LGEIRLGYPAPMTDEAPKSAIELAMERLRRKDEAEGAAQPVALTDAQRAAIAEARNLCEARLAEVEVMHRSRMARVADPAAAEALDQEYRRDRDRLISDRDSKIARIRDGSA
jgi:hypothetical protein